MATWTKDSIRAKLLTSDAWLFRAILAIFAGQTASEQAIGCTQENNGIGFNGADAFILSSFAGQIKARGSLSSKQVVIARKKMGKYSGQLERIANGSIRA